MRWILLYKIYFPKNEKEKAEKTKITETIADFYTNVGVNLVVEDSNKESRQQCADIMN